MISLEQKIDYMNKRCNGTLSIVHYSKWELGSYGDGSLFVQSGNIGPVRALSFAECVNKAYYVAIGFSKKPGRI